jgi:hypothetical protein
VPSRNRGDQAGVATANHHNVVAISQLGPNQEWL